MNTKEFTNDLKTLFCSKKRWNRKQVFGPGFRPHYQLYIVLEGKGMMQLSNELYMLQAGDTFLIEPGQTLYLEADEYNPWNLLWIAFSGEDAGTSMKEFRFSDSPVWHIPEEEKLLFTYANQLVDVFEKERSQTLEISGTFLALISRILPPPRPGRTENAKTYLERAKAYIEANYCYDILIRDISCQIGIDRSYVYRLFMDYEHMAPKDYLLKCRLDHACALMDEGKADVIKAAYSCGFADPESMNYHFQNKFGMTAEEYYWKNHK